ncbi:MAG: LamG domain-containing protein, partial [Chitinophagaceae bacterium]|nr:LamG domain-containing protein [Chitinophagaceae bacterium]
MLKCFRAVSGIGIVLCMLFFYAPLFSQTCNNWLYTPTQPSYVSIGDLDVTGNKITVEALCTPTIDNNGYGDLVSKHQRDTDCNYLLRLYGAAITTTTGFHGVYPTCRVVPNKVYHVAMVYDGATLRFYRNGFLMDQKPVTGNLVTNNWETWIGYFNPQTENENFTGFINEVRIWNVARTQAELRSFMKGPLPSPASQTGLQAYYTFDNLINKQGNAAWNGRLGGSAAINRTSTACTLVADSCEVTVQNTNDFCDSWLGLPSYRSYAAMGDLDVPGHTITVEARFMRTAPYTGGQVWAGDIVSKHNNPPDVNYLLRPNGAEIATTNGYTKTPDICDVELNKIYHAAMTYDGSTLKFYRNGFLMSSTPWSGEMILNDYSLRIGLYDALVHNEQLIGFVDEVRIWNVVRSQSEIRAFMSTSLPSPATQTGLLAYYTFEDLVNK